MNGIANITVGGQVVRLKFGLPAIRKIFEKMSEYEFIQDGIYTDMGMTHILYGGYINGCMLKDELPDIPFEAFYEYVEDFKADLTNQEEAKSAIMAFEQSRFVKKAVHKEGEAEEKKSP